MRNSTEDKIKIALIRHGETIVNFEKRYCGKRSDLELAKEGIVSLTEKKEEGLYPEAKILFASRKKRALQTAGILYPKLEPIVIEDFDEIDFGDFEGKNYADLKDNPDYQKWIDSNGEDAFPGGESKKVYCERVSAAFLKALDIYIDSPSYEKNRACEKESDIAIVAHGGTIMAILSVFAGLNYYDCIVKNGKGYIVELTLDKKNNMRIVDKL